MGKIRKRHRIRDFFIIGCSLLVCFSLVGVLYFYSFLDSLSGSGKGKSNIKPVTVASGEPVNVLLMGVDIGTAGSNSKNDPKRTDTIMLININPKLQRTSIISIPRDTLIQMNNNFKKINEAHAIGGPAYSIDAVEKLLEVKINYFAKVDYTGFDKIIDAVGPIEMKINNNMNYDDETQDLHIHFNKGEVVQLDGKKAEEFFRWRENNDGTGLANGDLGRIDNQHLFISKLIDKFKSPSIIKKLPGIFNTIPSYVETNMKAEDMIKYGYLLSKLDKANIKLYTMKGDPEYINGISYVVYDEGKNKDILNLLHGETALK